MEEEVVVVFRLDDDECFGGGMAMVSMRFDFFLARANFEATGWDDDEKVSLSGKKIHISLGKILRAWYKKKVQLSSSKALVAKLSVHLFVPFCDDHSRLGGGGARLGSSPTPSTSTSKARIIFSFNSNPFVLIIFSARVFNT